MEEHVKDILGPDWVIPAKVRIIEPRKYTWCYSFDPACDVTYLVTSAPSVFHRWMQRHFFGIHWRKLP